GAQLTVGSHRGDPRALDHDGGVAQHLDLRHLAPAPPARGAAAGDDLARAGEQRAQSLVSRKDSARMGSRMPWRRAASSASGYPASAWRAMPSPGSFVSTRSSRRPADGVPSATLTCPAWSEFPMPTPPPWWNETHAAPDAVLSSALRIAQSAIASEPSFMASVPRNGD